MSTSLLKKQFLLAFVSTVVALHLNVTMSFPSRQIRKLKSSVYGVLAYSQELLAAFEGTKPGI